MWNKSDTRTECGPFNQSGAGQTVNTGYASHQKPCVSSKHPPFGTRGSEVQILSLRPSFKSLIDLDNSRFTDFLVYFTNSRHGPITDRKAHLLVRTHWPHPSGIAAIHANKSFRTLPLSYPKMLLPGGHRRQPVQAKSPLCGARHAV